MTGIKEKILSFAIQVDGDSSIFTSKLMSDNGWSKSFALSAVVEYKKFLYLLYASNERLSPSKVIDKVWHCHLTFTHSYWHELCRDLLGKDIHHVPSSKGQLSREQDSYSYERMLSQYRLHFGEPDLKIWGKAPLQRPYWAPIVLFSAFLTACSLGDNSDVGSLIFWIIVIYVIYRIIIRLAKKGGGGGSGGSCGSSCSSSCGGD